MNAMANKRPPLPSFHDRVKLFGSRINANSTGKLRSKIGQRFVSNKNFFFIEDVMLRHLEECLFLLLGDKNPSAFLG